MSVTLCILEREGDRRINTTEKDTSAAQNSFGLFYFPKFTVERVVCEFSG